MLFLNKNHHTIAPKFKEMWMVMIKQGGMAEAALDVTNGTINSKTKTLIYSHCTLTQGVETAVEQSYIDRNFIDLRGRDFRGLNNRFV